MNIGRDNKGTVLVMVLLFMLATIVIGITLMRSAIVETRIVTNQKLYNQDFYHAESAAEIILPQFDDIVSATTWTTGTRVDISDRMPVGSPLRGHATVDMTLMRIGNPPVGSGTSAAKTTAYYYRVEAEVNNQSVEMGFWKAFPKPGT